MAVTSSRFKKDTNVFYLTGWGHAGDHWLSKALNAHSEIFVLNCYEPARLKYFNDGRNRDSRPDLLTMTAFLEDIGTDYQAIGECHAYRASQMAPVRAEYGDRVPIANLFRHPYTWLDFFIRHRVNNCRMSGTWSGALEHEWQHTRHDLFRNRGFKSYDKQDVYIWAAYQGMWLLHNIIVDLEHSLRAVRIEDLLQDRQVLQELTLYLSKGKCSFTEGQLDTVYAFAHQTYRGEESYVDEWAAYEQWPDWKKQAFANIVPMEVQVAYEKLGYRFSARPKVMVSVKKSECVAGSGPVILSSMMKSGTWMMRKILGEMTGLTPSEPIHNGDCAAYEDSQYLQTPPGSFFSWHFSASPDIKHAIRRQGARLIFLYRNIGDILVSLYYHFLNEPDAAIGYPTKNREFFDHLSVEGAMIFMINGFDVPPNYWAGASLFLKQMESMLSFSSEYPIHFVSYDNLIAEKEKEIRRLNDFLGSNLDEDRMGHITFGSSFKAMKEERARIHPDSLAHFRHGVYGDHANYLTPFHHRLLKHLILSTCPNLPKMLMENGRTDFLPFNDIYPVEDFGHTESYMEKVIEADVVLPLITEDTNIVKTRQRVLLYGMNILAHVLVGAACFNGIDIVAVTDAKHYYEQKRRMFPKILIVPPEKMITVMFDCVVVCATTGDWPGEINSEIRRLGVKQPVIFKDRQAGWIKRWD